MSASVPPSFSTMLPRYGKLSSALLSSMMGVSLTAMTFRILLLPLWMLRPKCAEMSTTVLFFSCICWCVREGPGYWQSSSHLAVSRVSTGCHFAQGCGCLHDPIYCQEEHKGNSKHPCLPPVYNLKASVSCPSLTTLRVFTS